MEVTLFHRLRTVFQHACTLAPAEREAYLTEAAPADTDLRREVDVLLAQDAEVDSLRNGVVAEVRKVFEVEEPSTPERIGSYEIQGLLGQGGMGLVYRARQEHPDREVALKVLRPGVLSERMLRRFELETQVLGRLRHPGIAQIYEAGTADVGAGPQPYFAMELVEGAPLLEHVAGLDRPARLILLIAICRAVHHAHQKGVIHRDLKPDNILVTAEGKPKILDFGVARLTDSDLRVTTIGSDIGQIIGTLPYMSPEQAVGASDDLDSRSDVYSLGVMAYEILGGCLPFDLSGKSVPEAVRTIAEEEQAPLSSLDRAYRGDLETVVGKALAKDPDRRYASAAELAADIERHLADQPILARPPSSIYLLKKLARRHSGLAAGILLSLSILLVAVVALSIVTVRARDAERTATRKAETALAVNEFLERFLNAPNPYAEESLGREAKVIDFLDAAAAELDGAFPDLPEVEGAVRRALGTSYAGLALYGPAQVQLEQAVELLRGLDDADRELVAVIKALAELYTDIDRGDEAIDLLRQVIEYHERVDGPEAQDTYAAVSDLINALWERGHRDEATELLEKSVASSRASLGEENRVFLVLLSSQSATRRGAEGLVLAEECYALHLAAFGPDDPDTLDAQHTVAMKSFRHGDSQEGERLMLEEFAARERLLGEGDPSTLWTMNALAELYRMSGRSEDSLALRLEQLRRIEAAGLATNRLHFDSARNAAMLLIDMGRLDDAAVYATVSADGFATILPEDHGDLLRARYTLADIDYRRGNYDESLDLLEAILDACEADFSTGSFRTVLMTTGRCAEQLGRLDDAEGYLTRALDLCATLDPEHRIPTSLRDDLSRIRESMQRQ